MWRHVAHVRTNVLDKSIASINRVERISELGTALAVTREWRMRSSSETSVHTWVTRRNIPEDCILHSLSLWWTARTGQTMLRSRQTKPILILAKGNEMILIKVQKQYEDNCCIWQDRTVLKLYPTSAAEFIWYAQTFRPFRVTVVAAVPTDIATPQLDSFREFPATPPLFILSFPLLESYASVRGTDLNAWHSFFRWSRNRLRLITVAVCWYSLPRLCAWTAYQKYKIALRITPTDWINKQQRIQ
jgi:hypothetical protein